MKRELLIRLALEEDMPSGDISSMYLFTNEISEGKFIAKEDGVISGIDVCAETFKIVDPNTLFTIYKQNGEVVKKGDIIALVKGLTTSILMAERVGLNFLQRMSGIATKTNQFVKKLGSSQTKILDTRKTTPLLRDLEKQAVRDGGGVNHRFSLSDMVMLKDNHLKTANSIEYAVSKVKAQIESNILIEVEVESIEMFKEALLTKCDVIMLDNMSNSDMATCVFLNNHQKKLEASGNMSLERIESLANMGLDYISVGALTHSYNSLDITLKF